MLCSWLFPLLNLTHRKGCWRGVMGGEYDYLICLRVAKSHGVAVWFRRAVQCSFWAAQQPESRTDRDRKCSSCLWYPHCCTMAWVTAQECFKINGVERRCERKHGLGVLKVSFHLGRQSWLLIPAPRAISLLYLVNSLEKTHLKITSDILAEKKKCSTNYGKRGFSSSIHSQLTSLTQEENRSISFEK